MKDVRIEIKAKNKVLFDKIHDNFESLHSFCKVIGISDSLVCSYIGLKIGRYSPYLQNGNLSKPAKKICEYFFMESEEIFPKHLYKVSSNELIVEIDSRQIDYRRSENHILEYIPETSIFDDERKSVLKEMLQELSDSQRKTIELRYVENLTYEECGERMGISRQRVHMIESDAIRSLRNSGKINVLRDLYDN